MTQTVNTYTDKRLPKGYTVFLNSFDEYVVCTNTYRVAQVDNGIECYNVRASRTLEGAIQHYLNNRTSNGMVE